MPTPTQQLEHGGPKPCQVTLLLSGSQHNIPQPQSCSAPGMLYLCPDSLLLPPWLQQLCKICLKEEWVVRADRISPASHHRPGKGLLSASCPIPPLLLGTPGQPSLGFCPAMGQGACPAAFGRLLSPSLEKVGVGCISPFLILDLPVTAGRASGGTTGKCTRA